MSWNLLDWPRIFFIVCLVLMWLSAQAGLYLRKRRGAMAADEREELNLVLTSALTLLALIIGFSFSMAVGRYDLRRSAEATEANAIGTEYLRVGMLGSQDATRLRALLQQYASQRVAAYRAGNESIEDLNASTLAIQREMWTIVQNAGVRRPDAITAEVAAGMNAVIDAEGYAGAAWANRIPLEAWILMLAIAICCCGLIGYDTRIPIGRVSGYMIIPLLVAISFFLISDMDSPHGGLIRVTPEDLITAAQHLRG